MSSQQAPILDTGWQGFPLTGSCQIPDALPSEGGDFYLDGDRQSPGQSVDSRGQPAFGQDCGWMPREISSKSSSAFVRPSATAAS
jgi:hypothetical protein